MPAYQDYFPAVKRRNFFAANFESIQHDLSEVNWDDLLSDGDVESSVDKFYSVVQMAMETHVPTTQQHPRSFPKWYDQELISLLREKKRTHCNWKRSDTLSHYIEFKRLRAMCIRQSRLKYRDYICSVDDQ